jgi:hypothetical protein
MSVDDIQEWVDNLEVVRLPAITSDIVELRSVSTTTATTLSEKVQEFTDSFSLHSTRITVADTAADEAQTDATLALMGVYDAEFNAKAYTDTAIQNLLLSTTEDLQTAMSAVIAQLHASTTTQIGNVMPDLTNELANIQAEVSADIANSTAASNLLHLASQALLNGTVPLLDTLQGQAIEDLSSQKTRIDNLLYGFDFPALNQGLDSVMLQSGALLDEAVESTLITAGTHSSNAQISSESAAASASSVNSSASSVSKDTNLMSKAYDQSLIALRRGTISGTAAVAESGNGRFQHGWTGWVTAEGLTTNLIIPNEIAAGIMFGDDSETIASIDIDLGLTQILRAGNAAITGA